MFGYSGNSESDVHELFAGLKRACANDPKLSAIAPGCTRHCHGWGYVILAENGLFHYRTATSLYDDDVMLPKLKGRIQAIFHGRYASDKELAGPIFSHPFVAASDTAVTYLAHNGGVNPPSQAPRNVDSEWVLDEIVRHGDIARALPLLKEHTHSALNLLILTVPREKGARAVLRYFHYFKPTEPSKVDYYTIYQGDMPGGHAIVSSTFTLNEAGMTHLANVRPVPFEFLQTIGAE